MYRAVSALCLCLLVLHHATAGLAAQDDTWVYMPSGARSTYFGIHGGTVPVSLLVSDDGAALVSFVGKTGNDFLDILRSTDQRLPSLLNGTTVNATLAVPVSRGHTLLARGAGGSLPVLRAGSGANYLLPFGFSEKPLSIEGHVLPPRQISPVKSYRLRFEPQYLQPKK